MTEERQDGVTAERQDGVTADKPVRRRPSTRKGRSLTDAVKGRSPQSANPASDPALIPMPETSTPPVVAPASAEPTSKYTIKLSASDALALDGMALHARGALNGKRVDKSEILRALIRLSADDASLRDQIVELLRG